jgi:p21-activated kinase 1
MAETEPPFADTQQIDDRWPPLSQPTFYSPAFRDFLRQCSEPVATRPTASELGKVCSSHSRFYDNLIFNFRVHL